MTKNICVELSSGHRRLSAKLPVQTFVYNYILLSGLHSEGTAQWLLIDFNVNRNCFQKFVLSADADPGGFHGRCNLPPKFGAPKLSFFWPCLIFPLFLPHFTWHIISLIFCYFFYIQVQKCSSLTLLSISFLI